MSGIIQQSRKTFQFFCLPELSNTIKQDVFFLEKPEPEI